MAFGARSDGGDAGGPVVPAETRGLDDSFCCICWELLCWMTGHCSENGMECAVLEGFLLDDTGLFEGNTECCSVAKRTVP
jgi:hypothetical protein